MILVRYLMWVMWFLTRELKIQGRQCFLRKTKDRILMHLQIGLCQSLYPQISFRQLIELTSLLCFLMQISRSATVRLSFAKMGSSRPECLCTFLWMQLRMAFPQFFGIFLVQFMSFQLAEVVFFFWWIFLACFYSTKMCWPPSKETSSLASCSYSSVGNTFRVAASSILIQLCLEIKLPCSERYLNWSRERLFLSALSRDSLRKASSCARCICCSARRDIFPLLLFYIRMIINQILQY